MSQVLSCLLMYMVAATMTPNALMPCDQYGFLYWAHGWRGRSSEGERLLTVQTSGFAAEWDVEQVRLKRLGRVRRPRAYGDAVSASLADMEWLPGVSLRLEVEAGGKRYHCVGADTSALTGLESPSRIIEAGRYLQRFDIQRLLFESGSGERLRGTGRLEVIAWPERLHVVLDVTMDTAGGGETLRIHLDAEGPSVSETVLPEDAGAGDVSISWPPPPDNRPVEDRCDVEVSDIADGRQPLPVAYDARRGWFRVALPERSFDIAREPQRMDAYQVRLNNRTDQPVNVPLLFAMEGAISGITGMTPLLLDGQGAPAGLPVQISKNWHRKPDAPELYDGAWFHGFALVPLRPGEQWEGEFRMVYAHWGGVPAVSHGQLCLIGWGVNQLWDQVAIGSWGETICYDPDINLNRSMIDDIRPLMVHGMRSTPEKPVLWNWTNNVGGGDFLVWFDDTGARRYPEGMRTAYRRYGPNLTEVVYAGALGDGAVSLRVTASSPRCDDVARAYHYLRYDVVKPISFSRLAFYQLGADNYNDHQFDTLARGDIDGLTEAWAFAPGGEHYHRAGVVCEGDGPWWFSMHDAIPRAPQGGAWANRGLIVRSWQARLGGQRMARPYAAFFGTGNGIPSMNVEIGPPPGLDRLVPGDYVEALVEVVVAPMNGEEYYGPNSNLRTSLEQHGNTWRPVHRLAVLNDLQITAHKGTLVQAYPMRIRLDQDGEALFSVLGGAGYVPCTFIGLDRPDAGIIRQVTDDLASIADPLASENLFKQVDYNSAERCYELTCNLLLDTPDDKPVMRHFRFSRE